uniref:GNAT family N-acetyltransferase n=1 Tax=Roseihalotalea indica TaxID=2867963 RepID=A0AA49GLN0_9BACT|nr:GNAT family N-acetyltransferase [Tunicatimonas sp. TK19036]
MMKVRKAISDDERRQAFAVREIVFVQEQNVPTEEEYDEYDNTAIHFVAYDKHGKACGTARWRYTNRGIKLERFAVLKPFRGKGAGAALLLAILEDISREFDAAKKEVYLHAQTTAVPFYEKFGFSTEGEEFEECNIKHYLMKRI